MKVNLIGEMAKRKISINDVAVLLGIHRNSVTNKLYGKTVFTLDEAITIADTYFKDCDFRWLFATQAA